MEVTFNFFKEEGSLKKKKKKNHSSGGQQHTCWPDWEQKGFTRCNLSFKGIGFYLHGELDPLPDSTDLGGPVNHLLCFNAVSVRATAEPPKCPDFSAGHFCVWKTKAGSVA